MLRHFISKIHRTINIPSRGVSRASCEDFYWLKVVWLSIKPTHALYRDTGLLTVYMDVQRNPGPQGELERVSAASGLAEGRLSHSSQDGVTRLSFIREKLIFLPSKAGYSVKHLPLNVQHKLRDLQILKYRGKRGGKRKEALTRTRIPTRITYRISSTRSCKRSYTNLRLLKRVSNTKQYHMPTILSTIIHVLSNKVDELQQVASLNKAQVICLTETWLSSNIQNMAVTLPGYSIFRSDRVNRDGDGVCAYISNSILCKWLADYHHCNVESLWLSLRPHSLPRNVSIILLGIIYHSTACREPENQVLCEHIQIVVDTFLAKYNNAMVIITGDFNPTSTHLDLSRIAGPNNLKQMVNFYTRDSGILDCFFRNRASLFELSRLSKIAASDHYVILANASLKRLPTQLARSS